MSGEVQRVSPSPTRRRLATGLAVLAVITAGSAARPSHAAPTRTTGGARAPTRTTDGARASPRYAGRTLAEVLLDLHAQGLVVVFSSELVPPQLRVVDEPASRQPRRVLDEVLAPHRLEAREAPGGVLVIVRAESPSAPRGAIEGAVLARGSMKGIAGASVRILGHDSETTTGSEGTFSIAELEAGTYALEARATGHLGERVDGVAIGPGTMRSIVFELLPLPYVEAEVVVRPSRLSLLLDQPDSTFALEREEIERLPHLGGDIFRAMSLLPGVAANDVTASFGVHGGRRDEVQILLDGQELFGAHHLQDFDHALSIVSASALSSATLTTGAFASNHGDRMSAVLDLRTVEPAEGRHGALGLSVIDALASTSGRSAGGGASWLATGRSGNTALAGEILGVGDAHFWDFFGKVDVATPVGDVEGRVLLAGDAHEVDLQAEDGFEKLNTDSTSAHAWLTHRASPASNLLVETIASHARLENDRVGAGRDEEAHHVLKDRRLIGVTGLSQSWMLEARPKHLVLFGWELRRYDADLDEAKELEPEMLVIAPFAPPRLTSHAFEGTVRGEHLAAWVSHRASLLDGRLTTELGLRHDRHDATDDAVTSPRVNLGWRLDDRSVVRLGWGRFYQSQRPYELQVEDGETELAPIEMSHHWVLGWERLFRARRLGVEALRVELFHRDVDDPRPRYENLLEPVNYFPEIEPDRVRIEPERSQSAGLEVMVRGRTGRRFDWWLVYSLSRAADRLDGRWAPRALDQQHAASLDMHVRLPRQWELNLAWRYRTGWPITPISAATVEDPEDPSQEVLAAVFGPWNSERLPALHRLDLRASRRFPLRRGSLSLYIDVQNLYDRQTVAGYDLELDEAAGTVLLDPEHWPGIFPSVGITWEF